MASTCKCLLPHFKLHVTHVILLWILLTKSLHTSSGKSIFRRPIRTTLAKYCSRDNSLISALPVSPVYPKTKTLFADLAVILIFDAELGRWLKKRQKFVGHTCMKAYKEKNRYKVNRDIIN